MLENKKMTLAIEVHYNQSYQTNDNKLTFFIDYQSTNGYISILQLISENVKIGTQSYT